MGKGMLAGAAVCCISLAIVPTSSVAQTCPDGFPQTLSYYVGFGRHTFRLRRIDRVGSFSYSPEVRVHIELAEHFALTDAWPNPLTPHFGAAQISFSGTAETSNASSKIGSPDKRS